MNALLASFHRPLTGSGRRLVLVILLVAGLPHSAPAQQDPFHTPVIDSIQAAADSMAAAKPAPTDTSDRDPHAVLRGLNALDDALPSSLMVALILFGFIVIPVASAVGFAAVALFSESGCLRVVLAVAGWGAALLGGFMGGGVLSMVLDGGLSLLARAGALAGGIGYPLLFVGIRTRIRQLPREEYLTWKHTLTGGALIGMGAGAGAGLARSAGALFKGGGGSFGGGGAAGTFGSGPVAPTAAAATAQGASAPGAVALTATSAVASAAAEGSVADAASTADAPASEGRLERWQRAVIGFARRLRWYHGVAFVLVGAVFLPVGMGLTALFQRPRLLLWIAGLYALGRAYWLIARTLPAGGLPDAIASLCTMLLFAAPFVGGVLAAESHAPQRHLVIVLVVAAVIEIGFFVLPDNRPEAGASSEQEPAFRGGSASERW